MTIITCFHLAIQYVINRYLKHMTYIVHKYKKKNPLPETCVCFVKGKIYCRRKAQCSSDAKRLFHFSRTRIVKDIRCSDQRYISRICFRYDQRTQRRWRSIDNTLHKYTKDGMWTMTRNSLHILSFFYVSYLIFQRVIVCFICIVKGISEVSVDLKYASHKRGKLHSFQQYNRAVTLFRRIFFLLREQSFHTQWQTTLRAARFHQYRSCFHLHTPSHFIYHLCPDWWLLKQTSNSW